MPHPVRDRAMRGHLAMCSVLRSSAYREYASSLRPCAHVDLTPPPAISPGVAGLRILFVTRSEATRHSVFPAGRGRSREEAADRHARRAGGPQAYFLYAEDP